MKKVLLTGGSGSIGTCIRHKFQESNRYYVHSLSSDEMDLQYEDSVSNFIHHNEMNYDVVIHCAGYNKVEPFERISMGDYNNDFVNSLNINLINLVRLLKCMTPYWKEKKYSYHSHVVIINSLYGSFARKGRMPYVVSKHGLDGLMKSLSLELAPHVLVNSVSPGYVQTEMTRKNNTEEQIKKIVKQIPMNRLASGEEIAKAVYFLVEDNNYITGHNLIVDGGYSAGGFTNE